METNIETYNPEKIMQGVKDRIKATFVNMIPDEQWDVMVKKEIDDYFLATKTNQKESNFGKMVQYELQAECKKRLTDYLASPEFQSTWDTNGKMILSDTVKKMMIENSGEIMANFFGSMFTQAFSSLRYQIQQQGLSNY